MDESFDYVRRIVSATETLFLIPSSTGIPNNTVIQRDGSFVTLRDGTTFVVDQRP